MAKVGRPKKHTPVFTYEVLLHALDVVSGKPIQLFFDADCVMMVDGIIEFHRKDELVGLAKDYVMMRRWENVNHPGLDNT